MGDQDRIRGPRCDGPAAPAGRRWTRVRSARLGAGLSALLALAGLACHGSSTSPSNSFFFAGVVTHLSETDHTLVLAHSGLLHVTMIQLRPIILDVTTIDPATIKLDFSLGSLDSTGAICVRSSTFAWSQGSEVTYGLNAGTYCLAVYDSGSLPIDAQIAYQLQADITR